MIGRYQLSLDLLLSDSLAGEPKHFPDPKSWLKFMFRFFGTVLIIPMLSRIWKKILIVYSLD